MRNSHQDRMAVLTGSAGGVDGHFAQRLAEPGCHGGLTNRELSVEARAAVRMTGLDMLAEAFDIKVKGHTCL